VWVCVFGFFSLEIDHMYVKSTRDRVRISPGVPALFSGEFRHLARHRNPLENCREHGEKSVWNQQRRRMACTQQPSASSSLLPPVASESPAGSSLGGGPSGIFGNVSFSNLLSIPAFRWGDDNSQSFSSIMKKLQSSKDDVSIPAAAAVAASAAAGTLPDSASALPPPPALPQPLPSVPAATTALVPTSSHLSAAVPPAPASPSAGDLQPLPNGQKYVDITEYLNMPQKLAAKKLGIPVSTLSKRWKEACRTRKWPYRNVSKLDREITTLMHNLPQGSNPQSWPPELEETLTLLLRKRQEELRPVVIRM
jgi:hypothetical protein